MRVFVPTILVSGLLLGARAPTQDLVAVKAGKVITMAGAETLENAVLLIENGRIVEIGQEVEPSWNAKVIDASDKVVMPTYVLAHTTGGLAGTNENMANVPYLTVEDAIDPSSSFFEEALRNGIGTMHVIPGNRTLLGGVGMIIRPYGRTVEDMTVRTKGGMKISLEASDGSRMAKIRQLRRAFTEVREYAADYERRKDEFEKEKAVGAVADKKEFDEVIDSEKKPVMDLLDGKHTAYLYVPSAAEVPEAIRIANTYAFDTHFVLGKTCYKASGRLERVNQPVILDDELEYREKDPLTEEETLVCPAAELSKRGIPFAISVNPSGGSVRRGGPSGASRYPWWQMATLVRHGIDRQTALESLTTVPARVLGIDDELGSLEKGKVANLQILTGDPLQATTWVDMVLLEGAVAYERSKDPKLQYLFGKTDGDGSSSR